MELVIYNRAFTKADAYTESVYIRIALMYAKQVAVSSFVSENLVFWRQKDNCPEKFYCAMHEKLYNKDSNPGHGLRFYKDLLKVRNTKNKNKEQLVIHQRMEQIMKQLKVEVLRYFGQIMDLYKLPVILQFCETKKEGGEKIQTGALILMRGDEYNEDTSGEDPVIKEIINSCLDEDESLILDEVIEKLVPFKELDDNGQSAMVTENADFFSSYLFEFPHLYDLSYEQLKYIREDLKSTLEVFHQEYKKLLTALTTVLFENSEQQIQLLLNTHIRPHLESIHKKIDGNIYIQQQKNRYGEGQRIKVMLGITSVENQIRLLEKVGVILPFVADAIIGKLEKSFNIKSCMPFVYHKLPTKPNAM